MNEPARLEARGITLGYGNAAVVRDLSLALPDGRITTLIGPNACGKSTVLRGLARLLAPRHGAVYLDGQAIRRLPAREVARRMALLSQAASVPEGITVGDLVRRGRYPHQGFFQPPSRKDAEAVERALALAGVSELRDQPVDQLSGGQRQRAWIAMALAQDTRILLLDEPTTYLDIAHQQEVLSLVWRLNRLEGRTVVMVLHDVTEAAAVSDRMVAMRDGEVVAAGSPRDVVTPANLERIYGLACDVVAHPAAKWPICVPRAQGLPGRPPERCSEPALKAAGVALGYGRNVVVEGLTVDIPRGGITAIVGANACGKSTLLRALGALLEPKSGEVFLGELPAGRCSPRARARMLAFLAQSPGIPPGISVEELVEAGRYPFRRWFRQWTAADESAVSAALSATAMEGLRHRVVDELSGGQRQRALLAMTLARDTPVLLLDEPTTFLDIAHQVEVLELVRRINRERGATVVMILHDLAQAIGYATHLVAMKEGRIVAQGAPAEVLTGGLVKDVFGIEATIIRHTDGTPIVLPAYPFAEGGGDSAPAPAPPADVVALARG